MHTTTLSYYVQYSVEEGTRQITHTHVLTKGKTEERHYGTHYILHVHMYMQNFRTGYLLRGSILLTEG